LPHAACRDGLALRRCHSLLECSGLLMLDIDAHSLRSFALFSSARSPLSAAALRLSLGEAHSRERARDPGLARFDAPRLRRSASVPPRLARHSPGEAACSVGCGLTRLGQGASTAGDSVARSHGHASSLCSHSPCSPASPGTADARCDRCSGSTCASALQLHMQPGLPTGTVPLLALTFFALGPFLQAGLTPLSFSHWPEDQCR
jgi:hypothetical protein